MRDRSIHDDPELPETEFSLGRYAAVVDAAMVDLQGSDVIRRMWRCDHTVWNDDPTEITDRLGWLTVTDLMREHLSDLGGFGDQLRVAGYKHVALLGMGGSSLGPEVLSQTFGSVTGFPKLIMLDSTVPAAVDAVTQVIDPTSTLFLVSSKSGSTIEPNVLFAHYWALAEQALNGRLVGDNFAAVTDPGSSLEQLGIARGFRRVFLNPSDIGGRYSVLSYFGLVPAALMGVPIAELLVRADQMRAACGSSVQAAGNPGAGLGVAIAAMARQGRNKLTLVTSPSIASFGLWAEQLLAESTGKAGRGIVPVAGEPLMPAAIYGEDRLFVYLRMDGDDNAETDTIFAEVDAVGIPSIRLNLRGKFDLGAEFYRWEFATAVAGSLLGLNPFDQPDVQSTKDMTDAVLAEFYRTGQLPGMEVPGSVNDLLYHAKSGDYLAIMAYIHQTPDTDAALDSLRRRVMERYGITTTAGYGPRFLHSTGQLHKGGPNTGLFLQLAADHPRDIAIPGQQYTFGNLADAQATGDLRALRAAGRRAVRVHLSTKHGQDIKAIADAVG